MFFRKRNFQEHKESGENNIFYNIRKLHYLYGNVYNYSTRASHRHKAS